MHIVLYKDSIPLNASSLMSEWLCVFPRSSLWYRERLSLHLSTLHSISCKQDRISPFSWINIFANRCKVARGKILHPKGISQSLFEKRWQWGYTWDMNNNQRYPTDLTDCQWDCIKDADPSRKSRGASANAGHAQSRQCNTLPAHHSVNPSIKRLMHVFGETHENSFPHATQWAKIRSNAAFFDAVRESLPDHTGVTILSGAKHTLRRQWKGTGGKGALELPFPPAFPANEQKRLFYRRICTFTINIR